MISFGVYLFGHLLLTSARGVGREDAARPGSVIGSVVRSSRTQLLRANKDLYERMQTRRYAALLRFGVAPSVPPLVVGSTMLHISWPVGAEIALFIGSIPVAVALWLEAVREYSISLAILVREVSAERVELELMKAKPANES